MSPAHAECPPPSQSEAAEIYVLDASAAVEYLLERPAGERVAAAIAGRRLIAPDLLDAEVMSALRGQVMSRRIDEARALEALDRLATMPIQRIPYRPLMPSAWQHYQNVSSYDALYVALAQANDATLLTADRRLARAPGLGVAVVDVGAEME